MSGILIIESDRKRQALLKRLLREHVQVETTIVASVEAAIAKFEECQPDVIVAPTLLSPDDSDSLCSHVKRHADSHVEMITIAALDMLREEPVEESHAFGFFRRRRGANLGLQYDPALVGRQIAESVERVRQMREQWGDRRFILESSEPVALVPVSQRVVDPSDVRAGERRIDERMRQNAPWLWTVRLPGGGEADLVNISRSGILLASPSRVSPGVSLELHVSSHGVNRIALARFVRSEVGRVDSLGVRYYSAARFDEPFELPSPHTRRQLRATPKSLADLFANVVTESSHFERRSVRFADGLRGLIGARDVVICQSPQSPTDGSESIYFTVKGEGASRTILQVMFDRHRALTSSDYAMLKAAAAMTTAVLELEPTCDQEIATAEVA